MAPEDSKSPHGAAAPSMAARMTSSAVMGFIGSVSRAFIYGFNTVETTGLERFLSILDERKDVDKRQRGLVTVSNHISIIDDPLMWGTLPFRYHFDQANHRWGLGAHDICFKNKLASAFFYNGHVLPTHRLHYSPHGGLFQPAMVQAIRLLSSQPFVNPLPASLTDTPERLAIRASGYEDIPDPFTTGGLTFSANGVDHYEAPSRFTQNRYGWVHIFPEACVHQHPKVFMRYFKWGVSRLILESEPMPDVLPIFIDGTQRVYPENRGFPRPVPRPGQRVRVAFGELLDTEARYGDLRRRWQDLVRRELLSREEVRRQRKLPPPSPLVLGELTDELRYGREAVELRIEVARRVREDVLKVRRSLGDDDAFPDNPDDARFALAETWKKEPRDKDEFKSNVDDSLVNKRK